MVDRIRALLLARQLSPTQFADAIGVARPIVSHILSGRNKPSLEVVQKILAAFSDLSMPWLLNGVGPMLAPAETPAAAESASLPTAPLPRKRPGAPAPAPPVPVPPVPILATTTVVEAASAGPPPVAASITAATPARASPLRGELPPAAAASVAATPSVTPAAPPSIPAGLAVSPMGAPPELAMFAEPGKAIRRIVIFYRDGTFADYQPE